MKGVLKQMVGIVCMGLVTWGCLCVGSLFCDWVGDMIDGQGRIIETMEDFKYLCLGWGLVFVLPAILLALSDTGMYRKPESDKSI